MATPSYNKRLVSLKFPDPFEMAESTEPLPTPGCSFHQSSTSTAIPLGYAPLFPASTSEERNGRSSGFKSLFPACDNGDSKFSGFKPLFPAGENEGSAESENKNADGRNYNWLQLSSSITTDELITDLRKIEEANVVNEVDEAKPSKDSSKDEYYHVSRSKKKKKKRIKSPSPDRTKLKLEQELIAQGSKKVFIEDTGLTVEHAFRVDRKFDQTNFAFTSFNPMHTARYYKDSNKPPLGLSPAEEVQWLDEKRGKVKKGQRNANRYCSRQNAVVVHNEDGILDYSQPRVETSKDKFQEKVTSCPEYIPFELSLKEMKLKDNENKTGNLTESTSNDDVKNSNETTTKETYAQFISRRTTEYNQQLRETPKDEEKWLEFIKFQDKVIAISFDNQQSEKKLSERGIFERKLSILDKAIDTIPSSVKLMVTKLKLCQSYWDASELKKDWNKLLFVHPNNIYVWESYLLYLQSHFSSFTFSNVVKGYAKCFAKLNSLLEGTFTSHAAPPDLETKMLGIFLKLCHFLNQAGHREKAIASFQAMIEFNCFTPKNLNFNMSLTDWLAFFEPFWDSSVPRFGEVGAIGWSEAMATKQLPDDNSVNVKVEDTEEDEIIQLNLPRNQCWLRLERSREKMHWFPWKPSAEESADDCEDPDRMVVIDDVSQFIFRLKTKELKFQLVQTFLTFLGQIREPHFTSVCSLINCHCTSCLESSSSILSRRNYMEYKFEKKNQLPALISDDDNLLLLNADFSDFVDRVMNQCVLIFDEPEKSEIQVKWFQLKRFYYAVKKDKEPKKAKQVLKDARKFSKGLLKEETNRNKVPLWLEYSKLELDSGHNDDAKKVFEMILLTQSSSVLQDQDATVCEVFKMYAELEISQKEKCLTILTALATGEGIKSNVGKTSPSILKAKRQFQSSQETVFNRYSEEIKLIANYTRVVSSVTSFKTNFLVEWFPCCAFFNYLTVGLQPAIVIYEGILNKLSDLEKLTEDENIKTKIKLDMERIYFSYVKLVLHHVNTTTSSLAIIRPILHGALLMFPENHHFLQLILDIESRSQIAGNLRRHFTRALKDYHSPTVCFYAVTAELRRLQNLRQNTCEGGCDFENGVSQRIQSLFEQALSFPECEHCPLLWRLYLKFQIERGSEEKAKAVFYRAVQSCVWSKKIYLEAAHIADCLQEILDVMTEKEIRIRIPIEEVDLLQKALLFKNESGNNVAMEVEVCT